MVTLLSTGMDWLDHKSYLMVLCVAHNSQAIISLFSFFLRLMVEIKYQILQLAAFLKVERERRVSRILECKILE